MKIEKRWTVKFKSVRHGQVFEYDGNIYIRTVVLDAEGRIIYNALNLESGYCNLLDDKIEVSLYENARIVFK